MSEFTSQISSYDNMFQQELSRLTVDSYDRENVDQIRQNIDKLRKEMLNKHNKTQKVFENLNRQMVRYDDENKNLSKTFNTIKDNSEGAIQRYKDTQIKQNEYMTGNVILCVIGTLLISYF